LFAVPEVAIFQDYLSLGGTNSTPTHDFNATFDVGKSYILTVALNGGGGGMTNGATLEFSFYYLDAASNKVTVAATTVTNTPALFQADRKHFTDFSVQVPTVTGREPWARRRVGVKIASTVSLEMAGGFWDLDNVRLRVIEDPVMLNPQVTSGQFGFTLQSAIGQFEVLAGTNLALPSAQWESLGKFTNFTGSLSVTDTNTTLGQRFYQVRPSP
jgi:hypothetical protein